MRLKDSAQVGRSSWRTSAWPGAVRREKFWLVLGVVVQSLSLVSACSSNDDPAPTEKGGDTASRPDVGLQAGVGAGGGDGGNDTNGAAGGLAASAQTFDSGGGLEAAAARDARPSGVASTSELLAAAPDAGGGAALDAGGTTALDAEAGSSAILSPEAGSPAPVNQSDASAEMTECATAVPGDAPDVAELVWDGDVTIAVDGDVAQYRDYTSITGTLFIGSVAPLAEGTVGVTTVELPNLRAVGGELRIENTQLTALVLPRLEAVIGQVNIVNNRELESLSLPELRRSGALMLATHLELIRAEFPRLSVVEGRLYIHRNLVLTTLELSALLSLLVPEDEAVNFTANPELPWCLVDELFARVGLLLEETNTAISQLREGCECRLQCDRVMAVCDAP